ncbi:S41 family peptidase, partial [Bacteroides caecigallinarum]|uniref:S41 family peptidase n=1 Tax=Bacteroides caecigallinarum TaxID=1411144 RepID=UPI001F1A3D35
MKKNFRIAAKAALSLLILLVLGFIILVIYAKFFYNRDVKVVSYYADELCVGKEDFKAEFEEIYQITLDEYSLYSSKHLNMDSLHEEYLQRIEKEAKTPIKFGKLLKEYFAALNAGHASVYLNDYTANYAPSYIEGRVFIDNPNLYICENGFQDKDEIVSINKIPVAEWITTNEKYTPSSTEKCRKLMTARKIFRSWSDTTATYQVIRNQDTVSLTLNLKKASAFHEKQNPTVEWTVLQDSIGYIRILSMMDSVVDEFDRAYQQVKDLSNLIVDVRENGGGSSGNGKKICEYLIHKPQPHCVSPDWEIIPRKDSYKGKLFLLTSTYTFSAAESFTLDLKESGNAIIIGEGTGGDTGNRPRTFHTTNGIYFRLPTREPSFSPNGFPMEGKSIMPHYEVYQSVNDFMKNRDTVLEFALKMIETNN